MTISSDTMTAGPYEGNSVTTSFPFTFKAFSETDIAVYYIDASNVMTLLSLSSDYTVSLNADQKSNPGGSITYPVSGSNLPAGEHLLLVRSTAYTQTLDLLTRGNFSAENIETQLDRMVMMILQLKHETDRALRLRVNDDAVDELSPPSAAEDSVIVRSSAGTFSFTPKSEFDGEDGADGAGLAIDASGPESDKSLYDAEAEGFVFLATDTNLLYRKESGTSGDWSAGVTLSGLPNVFTTKGDIVIAGTGGSAQRLALGSARNRLRAGASGLPEWSGGADTILTGGLYNLILGGSAIEGYSPLDDYETDMPTADNLTAGAVMPVGGVLSNLYAKCAGNSGTQPVTLTIYKDGVSTGLSVTIPAGSSSVVSNTGTEVTFTAGQVLSMQHNVAAGSGFLTAIRWGVKCE